MFPKLCLEEPSPEGALERVLWSNAYRSITALAGNRCICEKQRTGSMIDQEPGWTPAPHAVGSGQGSQARRRDKGVQVGQEQVKLCLFAENMIFYMENPKESIKNIGTNNKSVQQGYRT